MGAEVRPRPAAPAAGNLQIPGEYAKINAWSVAGGRAASPAGRRGFSPMRCSGGWPPADRSLPHLLVHSDHVWAGSHRRRIDETIRALMA